jgi:hypothetical protein
MRRSFRSGTNGKQLDWPGLPGHEGERSKPALQGKPDDIVGPAIFLFPDLAACVTQVDRDGGWRLSRDLRKARLALMRKTTGGAPDPAYQHQAERDGGNAAGHQRERTQDKGGFHCPKRLRLVGKADRHNVWHERSF